MPGTGSEAEETAAPSQSESQSSAAVLQAQSQSSATTFHQILPPQPLDLKCSSEIAENWKLWKEKYNKVGARKFPVPTRHVQARDWR